jgi:hypothetical protein
MKRTQPCYSADLTDLKSNDSVQSWFPQKERSIQSLKKEIINKLIGLKNRSGREVGAY